MLPFAHKLCLALLLLMFTIGGVVCPCPHEDAPAPHAELAAACHSHPDAPAPGDSCPDDHAPCACAAHNDYYADASPPLDFKPSHAMPLLTLLQAAVNSHLLVAAPAAPVSLNHHTSPPSPAPTSLLRLHCALIV